MNIRTTLYDIGISMLKLGDFQIILSDDRWVGQGGTCLVYHADILKPGSENEYVRQRILLKEFYPILNPEVSIYIERRNDGSLVFSEHAEIDKEYQERLRRFKSSFEMFSNLRSTSDLNNYIVLAREFIKANGTYYLIMDYDEAIEFDSYMKKNISLYDFLYAVRQAAYATSYLHGLGYLHLDLTPGNLLYFRDEYAKIIDTDSFISKNEITKYTGFSYSEGFAPPEIMRIMEEKSPIMLRMISRYGERCDIYSLGSIIFSYIFGHTPDVTKDGILSEDYNYEHQLESKLKSFQNYSMIKDIEVEIKSLLRGMLAYKIKGRFESMVEVAERISRILPLIDPKIDNVVGTLTSALSDPYKNFKEIEFKDHEIECETHIFSNLPEEEPFIGMENELNALHDHVKSKKKVKVIGMGGVGKSSFVKEYCRLHHEKDFENVIYMPVDRSLRLSIGNDEILSLKNDFISEKREKLTDYPYTMYKLSLLERHVDDSTLIVIDSIESDNDELLERVCKLNCNLVVVTRSKTLRLDGFSEYEIRERKTSEELLKIFEMHYNNEVTDQDKEMLLQFFQDVNGHTMMIVLLACQMNYWNEKPSDFKDLNQLQIDRTLRMHQIKSEYADSNEIAKMYHRLFSLYNPYQLNAAQRKVLKTMVLLPATGFLKSKYIEWMGEQYLKELNELEKMGWVQASNNGSIIKLHPVVKDIISNELDINLGDPEISVLVNKFIDSIMGSYDKKYQENLISKDMALSLYYQFPEPPVEWYKQYLTLSRYLWVMDFMNISLDIQNKLQILFNGLHNNTEYSLELAHVSLFAGTTYHSKGEYQNAEKELIKSAEIFGNKYAAVLSHLAQARMYGNDISLEELEPLVKQSLEIRQMYLPDSLLEAHSCHMYAKILSSYNEKLDEAIRLEKKAYRIYSTLEPENSTNLSSALYILGWLHVLTAEDEDDLDFGIEELEEAKNKRLIGRSELHPWMEDIYLKLAFAYVKSQNLEKAKTNFETLLSVQKKKYDSNPYRKEIVDTYRNLKEIYESLNDEEGVKQCKKYLRYADA